MIPSHGLHEMKTVTDLLLFRGLLLGLLGLPKCHSGQIGKADSHAERQKIRDPVMLWGPSCFGGQMQSQISTESNYVKRYALSLLRPERDRPHGPPTTRPSFLV
jgi:hypothetical protein